MGLAELPLALLVLGLAAYAVLAGADFGAGLWHLLARGPGREEVREHTHRAMAPVWEANHVWLIFVLVVCWTAYPGAFGAIFSTLYVPLFVAAVGIIVRGASYALHGYGQRAGPKSVVATLFGASSLLTPFALGTAIGAIAAERVPPPGAPPGDPLASWTGAVPLLVGALTVATAGYLAAVYLAGDAARAGRGELERAFRRRALIAGGLAGVLAIGGLLVVRADARDLFDGLTSGAGLSAVAASAVAGMVTVALVVRSRFEPARVSAAVAVGAIVVGWPLAQGPDFLPGLTVAEAAAPDATLVALLVSIAAGAVVLAPSLALLFWLVLSGRFDEAVAWPAPPRAPRRDAARGKQSAALAAAVFLAGAVLTVLSGGGAGRVAGVLCLLAGLAGSAAAALSPARLEAMDKDLAPPADHS